MTSASSSSNDLITDCAPVSCCGATYLSRGVASSLAVVSPQADAPLATDGPSLEAGRSDGLVMGELTVSSLVFVVILLWLIVGRMSVEKRNTGNKKPSPA